MRDHLATSARHRARFGHARRWLPPVARVVLARRGVGLRPAGAVSTVILDVTLAVSASRPVLVVAAAAPAPEARPVPAVNLVAAPERLAVLDRTRRIEQLTTARHLERIVTTEERQVVRIEQRVPQVTRVVTTHAATQDPAPGGHPTRSESGPPTPTPVQSPGLPVPPAPVDLARITDHVLGAIDHRLSAYAERLGRG